MARCPSGEIRKSVKRSPKSCLTFGCLAGFTSVTRYWLNRRLSPSTRISRSPCCRSESRYRGRTARRRCSRRRRPAFHPRSWLGSWPPAGVDQALQGIGRLAPVKHAQQLAPEYGIDEVIGQEHGPQQASDDGTDLVQRIAARGGAKARQCIDGEYAALLTFAGYNLVRMRKPFGTRFQMMPK